MCPRNRSAKSCTGPWYNQVTGESAAAGPTARSVSPALRIPYERERLTWTPPRHTMSGPTTAKSKPKSARIVRSRFLRLEPLATAGDKQMRNLRLVAGRAGPAELRRRGRCRTACLAGPRV
jgi:hypothetical protein